MLACFCSLDSFLEATLCPAGLGQSGAHAARLPGHLLGQGGLHAHHLLGALQRWGGGALLSGRASGRVNSGMGS